MLTEATWIDGERRLALAAAIQAVRWLASQRAESVAATRLPDRRHADRADRFRVAPSRSRRSLCPTPAQDPRPCPWAVPCRCVDQP